MRGIRFFRTHIGRLVSTVATIALLALAANTLRAWVEADALAAVESPDEDYAEPTLHIEVAYSNDNDSASNRREHKVQPPRTVFSQERSQIWMCAPVKDGRASDGGSALEI